MILADVGDGAYNFVFLLHVATFVAAFAPAIVHPVMSRQYRGAADDPAYRAWMRFAGQNGMRIYAPSLILTGLFGIILILLSDDVWGFDQTWVSIAFLVWILMNGVLHAVVLPAERKVAAGDDSAAQRIEIGGAALTVLFLVMLYLMIWKPGL